MNLMEILLEAGNEPALSQLGENLGLDSTKTRSVIGELVPTLSQAMQRNSGQPQGLEALAGALARGNHQQYLEQPAALTKPDAIMDGNAILGHLFGSKDVSRNVAAHASQNSGVDTGIIKKMLPMVAAMAMGALSKQTGGGSGLMPGAGSGTSDLLTTLLDSNRDGSVADDVLNLAKKFF